MNNNIWFDKLESQLKNVPVYGLPRPRKRLWEELVIGNTIDKGVILEFGVASGGSIGWFPKHFKGTPVHGFDSFEGLPEDWNLGNCIIPARHFSTNGIPPDTKQKEITYWKGLFKDTLPGFIKKYKKKKVKILHLDADLYSSTKYVLDNIYKMLAIGTIILFDELTHAPDHPQYIHNRQHEYKAFMEFCESNPNFDFEVIAKTNICQVAIKVISI